MRSGNFKQRLVVLVLLCVATPGLATEIATGPGGFKSHIAPFLQSHCIDCYPHASHSNNNYPLHLAGGNKLGFKHGNLHTFEGKKKVPLANLFVSMLNAADVPVERFADSTGVMSEIQS